MDRDPPEVQTAAISLRDNLLQQALVPARCGWRDERGAGSRCSVQEDQGHPFPAYRGWLWDPRPGGPGGSTAVAGRAAGTHGPSSPLKRAIVHPWHGCGSRPQLRMGAEGINAPPNLPSPLDATLVETARPVWLRALALAIIFTALRYFALADCGLPVRNAGGQVILRPEPGGDERRRCEMEPLNM